MEPHRVFCTKCSRWVSLGQKQTYYLTPWEKHRTRCDKTAVESRKEEEGASDADDAASTRAPSIAQSEKSRKRTTESERQSLMKSDPRVETVEPQRVLCKNCKNWIQLSKRTNYAFYNWEKHTAGCFGTL